MPSTTKPTHSTGSYLLELDGQTAAFVTTVEGGEPYAAVIEGPVDADGVVPKHCGPVEFAPITVTFGLGADRSLLDWITQYLDREDSPRDGAVIFLDRNRKESSRLMFEQAQIVELAFPELNATSGKSAVLIKLTLQPRSTRRSQDSAGKAVSATTSKSQKAMSASNFRLSIPGLETVGTKVNKVESIIVKREPSKTRGRSGAGILRVPNIVFTTADFSAQELFSWVEESLLKSPGSQANERTGKLEILDVTLKKALFTLSLFQLGIIRVQSERPVAATEAVARLRAECYCERMAFSHSD